MAHTDAEIATLYKDAVLIGKVEGFENYLLVLFRNQPHSNRQAGQYAAQHAMHALVERYGCAMPSACTMCGYAGFLMPRVLRDGENQEVIAEATYLEGRAAKREILAVEAANQAQLPQRIYTEFEAQARRLVGLGGGERSPSPSRSHRLAKLFDKVVLIASWADRDDAVIYFDPHARKEWSQTLDYLAQTYHCAREAFNPFVIPAIRWDRASPTGYGKEQGQHTPCYYGLQLPTLVRDPRGEEYESPEFEWLKRLCVQRRGKPNAIAHILHDAGEESEGFVEHSLQKMYLERAGLDAGASIYNIPGFGGRN